MATAWRVGAGTETGALQCARRPYSHENACSADSWHETRAPVRLYVSARVPSTCSHPPRAATATPAPQLGFRARMNPRQNDVSPERASRKKCVHARDAAHHRMAWNSDTVCVGARASMAHEPEVRSIIWKCSTCKGRPPQPPAPLPLLFSASGSASNWRMAIRVARAVSAPPGLKLEYDTATRLSPSVMMPFAASRSQAGSAADVCSNRKAPDSFSPLDPRRKRCTATSPSSVTMVSRTSAESISAPNIATGTRGVGETAPFVGDARGRHNRS
mmetsp:Transcript_5998/g.20266  ORF Transcript_5998/g.20266 Transcript_5998/m.20266 type:complete len:273 (+) Transcript_5998:3345-4163(+)